MLSSVPTEQVEIEGLGTVTVRGMTARCYAEMKDAKAKGADEMVVAATVARRCVEEFSDNSVEELLDNHTPSVLVDIFQHVIRLSNLDLGNSAAGPVAVSSSA